MDPARPLPKVMFRQLLLRKLLLTDRVIG
ncbi:hypothetical protein ACN38_g10140, partial [Penicillium nordicum]